MVRKPPRHGSEPGFDELFCALLPRLYRRAALISGHAHTAEDCVHEAYLKLAAHPDRLLSHPEPYAYAFTAMQSALRDARRRDRKHAPLAGPPAVQAGAGSWDGGIPRRTAELEAVRLLRHLSHRQACAVVLVDLDGYTIDQAAEILRVHRGTVARSRGRALERLRELLSDKEECRES